jgi:hypothetical protein
MSWSTIVPKYDEDTYTLIQIAVDFLVQYFGCTIDDANQAMIVFLQSYSSDFDEDALHHESSYRLAAIVHYLIRLKGSREQLGNWLVENGYNRTPFDAMDYFNKEYFKK